MSFVVEFADLGPAVDSVTGMSNISRYCMVRLQQGTLTIGVLDHDDTFMVNHTMDVRQFPGTDDATIYLTCADVQAGLTATSDVRVRMDGTKWYLPDRTWTTSRQRSTICRATASYAADGCHVRVKTDNFLLYIRQILICENRVTITSHGQGDLALQSSGELISIQINDSEVVVDSRDTLVSVDCSPKYIRAMLSVLSLHVYLDLYITDKQYIVIKSGQNCTIVLKMIKEKT